jgi:hypothetical protein
MRLKHRIVPILVLTSACGSSDVVPTQPNQLFTLKIVAAPASGSQMVPSPTIPSPAPPTQTKPTPIPSPTPAASSCTLGPGGGSGQNCPRTQPKFLDQVSTAVQDVVAQHPEYFDLTKQKGTGNYLVKDVHAFTAAVVAQLQTAGLCAEYDGLELGVKRTNAFNDQYAILVSTGYIRSGDGSYRATCAPAWF